MQKVSPSSRLNVYQIVTDRIVGSLKEGIIPWEKPWKIPTFSGGSFPRNLKSGKPYRGVNVFLLWGARYSSPFWVTFKQAQELGGTVRKGEKGTPIVFYKQLQKRSDKVGTDQESDQDRAPFILMSYTVFNVEQCDGLPVPTMEDERTGQIHLDESCEAIVTGWSGRPTIRTEIATESRAYYRPGTDSVHLPARFRFVDTAHYYATLFHELMHSTGHESRLARSFGERFGDELYSKEELIAETGAAFLCAFAGISTEHTERNTTAYLQNWISRLEQDNKLIVQAAASAQRAVDLITGHNFATDEEEGTAERDGPLVQSHEALQAA